MNMRTSKQIGTLYFRDDKTYTAEDLRRGIKIFSNTLYDTKRHGVLKREDFYVTVDETKPNSIIISKGYGFIRSTNDASYSIALNEACPYQLDNPSQLRKIFYALYFVLDEDENTEPYVDVYKYTNPPDPIPLPRETSLRIALITQYSDGKLDINNYVKDIEKKETAVGNPGEVEIKPLNMFFFKHIDISKGGITQQKQHYEMEIMPSYSLPKRLGFLISDSILKFKVKNRSKKSAECKLMYRLGYYMQDENGEREKTTLKQWYGKKSILAGQAWEDKFDIDTWEYEGSKKQVIHYAYDIKPYGRKMFLECYVEPTYLTVELKSFTMRDRIMQLKLYEKLQDS